MTRGRTRKASTADSLAAIPKPIAVDIHGLPLTPLDAVAQNDEDLCKFCKVYLPTGSKAVQCDRCSKWVCQPCSRLDNKKNMHC